jgi:hypothetical protein
MLAQPLQAAAKEFGKYCPVKNELLVREGRKTHRFIFGDGQIRVVFPAGQESVLYVSTDITVRELKQFIARMTASKEY